jgi:hypothetical protein
MYLIRLIYQIWQLSKNSLLQSICYLPLPARQLTVCCGLPLLPSISQHILLYMVSQEKNKDLNYYFYWVCIVFVPLKSQRIKSRTAQVRTVNKLQKMSCAEFLVYVFGLSFSLTLRLWEIFLPFYQSVTFLFYLHILVKRKYSNFANEQLLLY